MMLFLLVVFKLSGLKELVRLVCALLREGLQ
jgi:hypothetical protein